MKIFITGGAGYIGSALVPKLLDLGYDVTVLDLMIYGSNVLKPHENLTVYEGDIRDAKLLRKSIKGNDAVIHLACISNDPSYELNPSLAKSINYEAFMMFVEEVNKSSIKKFIYASSSSVYGVKAEENVT